MSIFTKDCPQCAETNAAYAVRCRCGFAFSADAADAEAQTEEEIALEEEKLYQEYLAARAKQASGGADDDANLTATQPADQSNPEEVERAPAELQTKIPASTGTTETKPASVEPPATAAPTPKPPAATPATTPAATESPPAPVKPITVAQPKTQPAPATVPSTATGISENKSAAAPTAKTESAQASVNPPAATPPMQPPGTPSTAKSTPTPVKPAAAEAPTTESAPTTAKPPTATPPLKTAGAAGTAKAASVGPASAGAKSWLISKTEPDAPPQTSAPALSKKLMTTRKPEQARPAPAAAKTGTVTMSAAERAKKLEQRLKAVQAKRDSNAAAMGTHAINKIHSQAAKSPSPEATRVPLAATGQPAAASTPADRAPAMPQPTPAAETNDIGARPRPTQPTSAATNAKPDQPQTVDKTPAPEPKKINGSDAAAAASNTTIEPRAAEKAAPSPTVNATAKADLEAALQALNTKTPETESATPAPAESGNGADAAAAAPEELPDTNSLAPLGDLTDNKGLGCTEKECPNCTALVPMDADRCGCNFVFPTDDNAMPSLSLTDSDVEALEKRKKSSGISHLG